ncbi:MAG: hypothetical protein NT148_02025 [Candidatus Nealsonbacteria bacterium]|nr:hypothetical protein [Candidatus Nealsonbacteria bacterium]
MNNKGSALLYTVLLLSILLTVVLGLSTLISAQFEIMKGTGNSVVAFYAADAGMERAINYMRTGLDNLSLSGGDTVDISDFSNGATYKISIRCKNNGQLNECASMPPDGNCNADNFCIKSVGTYKGVKRALMVTI